MAGRTETYFANGMYINKARFQDIKHLHDEEEVDSEEDQRSFVKTSKKANDIIRKGAMMMDDTFTIESYNHQLIKHNSIYSKLVSEFISNSELIVSHMARLPHHEVASELAKEAMTVN